MADFMDGDEFEHENKSGQAKMECPICSQKIAMPAVQSHVEECLRIMEVREKNTQEEQDREAVLELKRQMELERQPKFPCLLCQNQVPIEKLYSLDECSHRFCHPCLANYVSEKIQTEIQVLCPVCSKELTVRDLTDFLPSKKKRQQNRHIEVSVVPRAASGKATQRLMKELKVITAAKPETHGYSVATINDNIYHWELKLINFDDAPELVKDMKTLNVDHVLLHMLFPSNYPFEPPFVRVIRPRFGFHTGHVTIGGSICMELLTISGWSPANTVEATILSILNALIEGRPRLDLSNKADYSERDAREAFKRVAAQHGWE